MPRALTHENSLLATYTPGKENALTASFYERYGIRTLINAAGPMTKLSGHVLAPGGARGDGLSRRCLRTH